MPMMIFPCLFIFSLKQCEHCPLLKIFVHALLVGLYFSEHLFNVNDDLDVVLKIDIVQETKYTLIFIALLFGCVHCTCVALVDGFGGPATTVDCSGCCSYHCYVRPLVR